VPRLGHLEHPLRAYEAAAGTRAPVISCMLRCQGLDGRPANASAISSCRWSCRHHSTHLAVALAEELGGIAYLLMTPR